MFYKFYAISSCYVYRLCDVFEWYYNVWVVSRVWDAMSVVWWKFKGRSNSINVDVTSICHGSHENTPRLWKFTLRVMAGSRIRQYKWSLLTPWNEFDVTACSVRFSENFVAINWLNWNCWGTFLCQNDCEIRTPNFCSSSKELAFSFFKFFLLLLPILVVSTLRYSVSCLFIFYNRSYLSISYFLCFYVLVLKIVHTHKHTADIIQYVSNVLSLITPKIV